MLRYLAIIGAGTLGILALWIALVALSPTPPPTPVVEKIGPGSTTGEPSKPRDMMGRPATPPEPAATAPRPATQEPQRQASQPAIEQAPAPQASAPEAPLPAPADEQDHAADQPAAADGAASAADPATGEPRFPKGSAGCTRYKTYDAQTQTYRGYDGVVRPCRPL